MYFRYVLSILSVPLLILAGAQLLLLGWSYSYGDPHATIGFAAGAGVAILTGAGMSLVGESGGDLYRREGVLIVAMIVGGCAGSTAGGMKIVRGIIGWKAALREVRLMFSPNSVIAVFVQREAVPEASVHSVVALLLIWLLTWGVGAVLLTAGDTDIVTAATASISMISNVGPGLGAAGPTENFAHFAHWQKPLMVFLMWCGRLEFFSLLALFQRRFWQT